MVGKSNDSRITLGLSTTLFTRMAAPPPRHVMHMQTNTLEIIRRLKKADAKMLALRNASPERICQKMAMAALDPGKTRYQYTEAAVSDS
jgi:hypothetical protein